MFNSCAGSGIFRVWIQCHFIRCRLHLGRPNSSALSVCVFHTNWKWTDVFCWGWHSLVLGFSVQRTGKGLRDCIWNDLLCLQQHAIFFFVNSHFGINHKVCSNPSNCHSAQYRNAQMRTLFALPFQSMQSTSSLECHSWVSLLTLTVESVSQKNIHSWNFGHVFLCHGQQNLLKQEVKRPRIARERHGWKWWTCFCTFVLKELMHGMVFLWLFGSPMGQASGVLVACRHATHKHINTSKQEFHAAWNPLMDRRDAEPLILAGGVFHFDSSCLSLGFLWVDSGPLPWTSMEMTRQFWPESDPFSLCDSTWVRFNLL